MMLVANEVIKTDTPRDCYARLTIPFDLRQKSRFRTTLDNKEEIAVMLPRGTILRGGDQLQSADARVILVCAQPEPVSTVRCSDPLLFARACYHLGNRHVALQVEREFLRYARDHVLDDMMRSFGLMVEHELAAFEPEAGAYHHGH